MAGKIVADIIESAGSQISLNVGNVTILTASSSGLTLTPTSNVNINVSSSTLAFGAGSVSLPSITTSGDTNTGLFFPAADTIAFAEGGAEAMRINSSGNLQANGTISVGNATPSTSGAGITFPSGDTHYSSNANTLDDYEEGTWTPTFGGSGSDPTGVSYGTQEGTYTKIGNRVFVEFYLTFTTFTGGANTFYIRGLPFTGSGNGDGPMKIENVSLTAGKTYLVGTISASVISPNQVGSSTTWNGLTIGTNVTTSATVKYFTGSLCYKI